MIERAQKGCNFAWSTSSEILTTCSFNLAAPCTDLHLSLKQTSYKTKFLICLSKIWSLGSRSETGLKLPYSQNFHNRITLNCESHDRKQKIQLLKNYATRLYSHLTTVLASAQLTTIFCLLEPQSRWRWAVSFTFWLLYPWYSRRLGGISASLDPATNWTWATQPVSSHFPPNQA